MISLKVSFLQLADGIIGSSGGECHVGERGVLTTGGYHGGSIGAEDIFGSPDLVVLIEN